jgi:hypothetical protein
VTGPDLTNINVWHGIVTPELAQKLLDSAVPVEAPEGQKQQNRKISPRVVITLSEEIRKGRWVFNGAPILLNEQGVMIDGQHRCTAIVETGIGVESLIVRNVSQAAQDVTDVGRKRTFADKLRMQGYHNHIALANTVRLHWALEVGFLPPRGYGSVRYRPEGSIPLLDQRFKEDVEGYIAATRMGEQARKNASANTAGASVFYYRVSRLPTESEEEAEALRQDIDMFFEKLKFGQDLADGDPILALRRNFSKTNPKRPKMHYEHYALMVKAWNYWRRGRQVRVLLWKQGGASPERLPEFDT